MIRWDMVFAVWHEGDFGGYDGLRDELPHTFERQSEAYRPHFALINILISRFNVDERTELSIGTEGIQLA